MEKHGTNIGENIKVRRMQKGMTQQDVAEKAGVTRDCVAQWETGRTKPRFDMAMMLSDIFECTVNDLTMPVVPAHIEGEEV